MLTLPLVLLTVGLLEDLVSFKARQHVHDLYWRTALVLLLNGVAFAIAATWVTPAVKRLLVTIRQSSRRGAGLFGMCAFYSLAYGALFLAYLVVERHGAGALLPRAWR
jgi:hypothetical protein